MEDNQLTLEPKATNIDTSKQVATESKEAIEILENQNGQLMAYVRELEREVKKFRDREHELDMAYQESGAQDWREGLDDLQYEHMQLKHEVVG